MNAAVRKLNSLIYRYRDNRWRWDPRFRDDPDVLYAADGMLPLYRRVASQVTSEERETLRSLLRSAIRADRASSAERVVREICAHTELPFLPEILPGPDDRIPRASAHDALRVVSGATERERRLPGGSAGVGSGVDFDPLHPPARTLRLHLPTRGG
jgi:hypothetical protein